MKAIKITVLLLFLTGTIYAQNCCESGGCYIRLDDISGVDTDTFQNSLQAAACELVQAFPEDFRRDFRVYDFGFYLHNENFDGSYPDVFEQVKSQIDKPYYLLFGKQTDSTGVYNKIWVEVKLPETNIFECYTEEERAFIPLRILSKLNETYDKMGRNAFYYAEAEISGMNKLIKIINKAKECCYVSALREPDECPSCPDNDEIKTILERYGFFNIPVSNLTINPMNKEGVVKQNASISAKLGNSGEQISLNNYIVPYLEEIDSVVHNVYGSISHYDQLSDDYNCMDIMNIVYNTNGANYSALINKSGRNDNRRNKEDVKTRAEENIYLKVDVISLKDLKGNEYIYYRFSQNITDGNSKFGILDDIIKFKENSTYKDEELLYMIWAVMTQDVTLDELIEGHDYLSPDYGNTYDPPPSYIEILDSYVPTFEPDNYELMAETKWYSNDHEYDPQKGIIPNDLQYGYGGDPKKLSRYFPNNRALLKLDNNDLLNNYFKSLITDGSLNSDLQNVANDYFNRWVAGTGGDYFNQALSEYALTDGHTIATVHDFGELLNDSLKRVKGDLCKLPFLELEREYRAVYGEGENSSGLGILVHDTEKLYIYNMDDYHYNKDSREWEITLYFQIFDNFGLDDGDLEKFQGIKYTYHNWNQGFAAWWILQHIRGYKPFRTEIRTVFKIKGDLDKK